MVEAADFEQIARCVDSIGTPDFPRAISRYCAALSGAEMVYLSALFRGDKPAELYSDHTGASERAALQMYLDVAYLLDPFYLHFTRDRRDAVIHLDDIAPDDFRKSEYYLQFYESLRLEQEWGLMLHIGEAALFFSFSVRDPERVATPERLVPALPLISALVHRHWTVLSPERPDGAGRLAAHLEAAFEAFGSSVLSPRESEIVRMILRGHSSKAIAREFGNSPETIKVHRKRVYAKLGVVSQGELLSMFLDALSRMPATASGDPLAYLDSDIPG